MLTLRVNISGRCRQQSWGGADGGPKDGRERRGVGGDGAAGGSGGEPRVGGKAGDAWKALRRSGGGGRGGPKERRGGVGGGAARGGEGGRAGREAADLGRRYGVSAGRAAEAGREAGGGRGQRRKQRRRREEEEGGVRGRVQAGREGATAWEVRYHADGRRAARVLGREARGGGRGGRGGTEEEEEV
ncbi:glycine-rich cell wall structural protein 1.8-like [Asparagus officinalis]|uniref:glycine-rich cell wall structural protein 1.8-like n=1 Tax=Asparagus officinalis TaxID=4686 RepID=UPI00098E5AA8|nr:glycine-rich cell wall structural protein 1.8-like [Asparagus officinalis]